MALDFGIPTVPIPLADLARVADKIVVAKILRAELKTKEVVGSDGKPQTIPVKEIEYEVIESVQNGGAAGTKAIIAQYAKLSSPVAKDDKVLWFLSHPNGYGFVVPLGLKSGHFQVITPEQFSKGLVINLHGNAHLWKEDASLWESSSECSKDVFIKELNNRKVSKEDIESYLTVAGLPCRKGRLPLDFVVAAALSCLVKK